MNLSVLEESTTLVQHSQVAYENEKKVDDDEIRAWADLPSELLDLIFSYLFQPTHISFRSIRDHIRFRLTCKVWQSVHYPPGQFPLLMFFRKSAFHFFNPITNEEILDDDMEIPKPAKIHCSRFGWLLMSRARHSLFFHNLFIPGSSIELPEFTTRYVEFVSMSFTAPPTSSDCIVYAHNEPKPGSRVVIHRWCYGEDDWTDYHIDCELPFWQSYCNPIFYKNVFYQLDIYGRLGVSDPKKGNEQLIWKDLPQPKARKDIVSRCTKNYMAECDGELVLVIVSEVGRPIHVFELDWSKMEWVTMQSLGNKAMFISETGSLLIKTNGGGAENKIYFPLMFVNKVDGVDGPGTKEMAVFYCLETRKYNISSKDQRRVITNFTWIETKFQL